jgi:argininosuccinate lyase
MSPPKSRPPGDAQDHPHDGAPDGAQEDSQGATARPLWAKGAVALDAAVQRFCAADDVVVDRAIFAYDVRATAAHVSGLARIGILTADEGLRLVAELGVLEQAWGAGGFVLDERYEDGHSAIEAFLTERCGELGKKVHTARSRNDQVLVAQRMYLRAQLERLLAACREIARRLLARARTSVEVAMPGYTHMQRAMPMSLAMWLAGHAEGFLDDAHAAGAARAWGNASPLGTGAGFGVSLPLDRDGVAAELGFDRLVVSPLAAQNGRGKVELQALQALHLAALDVRRLAWDLSLFSSAEHGFVRLPDSYTTGSSLMPNKRNPDVIELLRALPGVVEGALVETAAALALPSSYHRDLQTTKAPLVRAFERALAGLELMPALVDSLSFDEAGMRAAISPDMYATDRALELVAEGVPFREAYVQAAGEIATLAARTPEGSLRARVSLGGAANLGLERLEERLRTLG